MQTAIDAPAAISAAMIVSGMVTPFKCVNNDGLTQTNADLDDRFKDYGTLVSGGTYNLIFEKNQGMHIAFIFARGFLGSNYLSLLVNGYGVNDSATRNQIFEPQKGPNFTYSAMDDSFGVTLSLASGLSVGARLVVLNVYGSPSTLEQVT